MRNSEVIICNLKIDRSYTNVLSYTREQMVALCRANQLPQSGSANNFSFVEPFGNEVLVPFSYANCVACNYIAFQNPNYSGKWYFAFVDEVIYENDATTRIKFTIDVWSTYYDDFKLLDCFIIREHVNNDNIGVHTIDEGLETGSYIVYNQVNYDRLNDISYVLQVTESADGNEKYTYHQIGREIFAGNAIVTSSVNYLEPILADYASNGRSDAIYNAYCVPSVMLTDDGNLPKYVWRDLFTMTKSGSLDGYVPKNKKCLCYPYNFLVVSNNNGSSNILRYENSRASDNLMHFIFEGVPCCGVSIICYPLDYGSTNDDRLEALPCGKFPTLSWAKDNYTNWLTQNAVNISRGTISGTTQMVLGAATLNLGQAIEGFNNIFDTANQMYQQSFVPQSVEGQINVGDVNFSAGYTGYTFYQKGIKKEYAYIIDEFFTRFGYKINRLGKPNLTGRRNWNYIKISSDDNFVYVHCGNNELEQLNNIARKGVTIWHNHDNIGNYTLDNSIV